MFNPTGFHPVQRNNEVSLIVELEEFHFKEGQECKFMNENMPT
jgi:hypothetical protein